MNPSLPQLSALARAGAVSRAWELFNDAGYAERSDDPAALAIAGRLLKGLARLAAGDRRRDLMAQAAYAYERADAAEPAPYLSINAASLRLLGGDARAAKEGAGHVLRQLADPVAAQDTPYFLAATRAEALLLIGDRQGAEAAMADAAHADPDGWADRAATVAQLREVAAALGDDAAWLDAFAPPASLHFAGHMGIAASGAAEAGLRADLEAHLAAHPVGFAWGALAAGSDIVIAEALVRAGAQLNVVLPCPVAQFAAQSVAPAGDAWSRRFAALIAAAASVRIAAETATSVHDPLATAHAGDLAIGGALSNAALLASRAEQLIVLDQNGGGANTARQAERWHAAHGPQHLFTAVRDTAVEALFPPERPEPARQLVLHLCVIHDVLARGDNLPGADLMEIAKPVAAALASLPGGAVRAGDGGWQVTVNDLAAGLAAAHRLAALGSVAVGAHIAISTVLDDPASGALVPFGNAPALTRRIAALAPTGTVLASDALAVTLCARSASNCRSELYYPREDELGGPVHMLIDQ